MRVVAVIQARLRSTRFPGKVLADLGGRPVLAHVIERARAIPGVDRVCVAVPFDEFEHGFLPFIRAHLDTLRQEPAVQWVAVEGDVNDVLGRFVAANEKMGADIIVRLTSDNPLIDPALAARCLAIQQYGGFDYVADLFWPGLDVEVVTRAALETAHREALEPDSREHVTLYVANQSWRFRSFVIPAVSGLPWLSIDTEADYERVRRVVAHLKPGEYAMSATLRACREAGL